MEPDGIKNFDKRLRESRTIRTLSQTCSRLRTVFMHLIWHSAEIGSRMRDHDHDMERYLGFHDNIALALSVKHEHCIKSFSHHLITYG
jgi:hypothetical protein